MATSNSVPVGYVPLMPGAAYPGTFKNESVSFVSISGDNSSFRTVPAGKVWLLMSLRGLNGDSATRGMSFLLADGDGTLHATPSMNAQGRNQIPAGEELAWTGLLFVPAAWRVYTKWFALNVGQTCNWQYCAIEYDID